MSHRTLRLTLLMTADAVLFAGTGSNVVDATVATFAIDAGGPGDRETLKVAVIVRVTPAGIVPRLQGNAVVQSPAFDMNVSPAGVGSLTVTDAASDGPALVTVIM
jgi:hypothetical protein